MIAAPMTVFPAKGRVLAAQAGAQPAGESAFGVLLDSIVLPAEAGCARPAVEISPPDEELMAETGEADIAVIPLAQMEPLPVAALGVSGGLIAFSRPDEQTDIGIADLEIDEDREMPLAKPSAGAGSALVELVEEGEVTPSERTVAGRMGPEGGGAKLVASVEQTPAMAAMPIMPAQTLNARGESPVLSPPPATPPAVARQVADAILNISGDSTEIVLTPPELGTVRIVIARDPHGLVVTLAAERPEALDLLRRHADLLRQELSLQGDEAARLDFLASGQREGGQMGGRHARTEGVFQVRRDDEPIQLEPMMRPVAVPGRIDMRI